MKMESPLSKNCVQLKSHLHHQCALKFTKPVWIVLINLSKITRTKKGDYSFETIMRKCTRTPTEYGTSGAKDSLLHFVS